MTTAPARPWALLAELTHACPLHCGYCSNPLELTRRSRELTTAQWTDLMRQAGGLGVVHTHLSGGEPLLRRDLEQIVTAAETAGIYTQLVTSGVGLDGARLSALVSAGLRSVQLSVQHSDPHASDRIAGRRSFAEKEEAATLVRAAGLPLGLNVVLHRENLDAVDALIELGLSWGVDRIELANTQFYGWGLLNRTALLPTRDQLARARDAVDRWRSASRRTAPTWSGSSPTTSTVWPSRAWAGGARSRSPSPRTAPSCPARPRPHCRASTRRTSATIPWPGSGTTPRRSAATAARTGWPNPAAAVPAATRTSAAAAARRTRSRATPPAPTPPADCPPTTDWSGHWPTTPRTKERRSHGGRRARSASADPACSALPCPTIEISSGFRHLAL